VYEIRRPGMNQAKCKACGAAILWVEMASGKKMPLDAKAVSMVEVKERIGQVVQVYVPHWSTCPGAVK
jgi:hypothetical protein